jgi:hypothetical protein
MKKHDKSINLQAPGYRTSEQFREKLAARFDASGKPKKSKKRKIGFFVIMADVLIISVIFVFYSQRGANELYKTITFRSEQCDFRFSIATEKDSENYVLTLTAEPVFENETTLLFNENVANIDFIYNEKNVFSVPIGNNITELKLAGSDIKTFAVPVSMKKLNNYILEKGDYKPKKRKHLFNFEGTSVMLQGKLTLDTKDAPDKISETIEFRTGNLK